MQAEGGSQARLGLLQDWEYMSASTAEKNAQDCRTPSPSAKHRSCPAAATAWITCINIAKLCERVQLAVLVCGDQHAFINAEPVLK